MKCVKNSDGHIRRVRDDEAADMVEAGTHNYCPKKEWKKQEGIEYRGK